MEKVVVPQFVADYIENHYGGTAPTTWDKADLIRDWDTYIDISENSEVKEWVKNESNFLMFITAIITNDYEVEEEKKYYWRKKKEYLFDFEYRHSSYYINLDTDDSTVFLDDKEETDPYPYRTKFTEIEIRKLVSNEDFSKLEKVEITE